MRPGIIRAVETLTALRVGQAVTVTDSGRTYEMIVSREARRSDGAFGSYESTYATVTFGPGRYSIDIRAEKIAAGVQAVTA